MISGKIGDRVSAKAIIFDDPKASIKWSIVTFGSRYDTARCYGIIKKITGPKNKKVAHVLWDLDKKTSKIDFKDLELAPDEDAVDRSSNDTICATSSSNQDDKDRTESTTLNNNDSNQDDTNRAASSSNQDNTNHAASSSNQDNTNRAESSSPGDSDVNNRDVNNRSSRGRNVQSSRGRNVRTSRGRNVQSGCGRNVQVSSTENTGANTKTRSRSASTSSNSSSSSESESSNSGAVGFSDDNGACPENEVTVHDTLWTFHKQVRVDAYKDAPYGPRISDVNNDELKQFSPLQYWKKFFPVENVTQILNFSNDKAGLQDGRSIREEELYKFFGILYAMTLQHLAASRCYWSTVDGLFPAPSFGVRFGMSRNRFEEIKSALCFHPQIARNSDDKWYAIRPLIEMLNLKWSESIFPGYKITVDESMFAWYGKGKCRGGMPAVMKIKRKPKGVGCEIKNAADSVSNIMIRIEVNEGKEEMAKKKWQSTHGAGTATALRLLEPWFGTNRIVVGDSWFASVKTAVQFFQRGLYFMGVVKTATKKYPKAEIIRRCPPERGSSVSAVASEEDIPLLAMGWRDKKIICLVSSCGTTFEGPPARKRRLDDDGNVFYKEVKRPKLYQNYFDGAPSIDVHNHLRQDGLALEKVWKTTSWEHRMIASLLGIIETNAYLAYQYFTGKYIAHSDFTEMLAKQLIFPELPNSLEDSSSRAEHHVLKPLATTDDRERKRVQKKCIVCRKINHIQQKASYYCVACGPLMVLCSPQTLRNCFQYHIEQPLITADLLKSSSRSFSGSK